MMYGVMTRQRSHSILQLVTLYLGAPGEKFQGDHSHGPGVIPHLDRAVLNTGGNNKTMALYIFDGVDMRPFDRDGLCVKFSLHFFQLCPVVPSAIWCRITSLNLFSRLSLWSNQSLTG